MNIALFASAFYPHVGGVEELCRQLAQEFLRRGLGVTVLTNRWPRSLPARENVEGIDVVRFPFRLPDGSLKSLVNYHLTHRAIRRKLLALLRERNIDLLHVQCVSASTDYAIDAARQLGVPLVVTTQGERTMDSTGLFQRSARLTELFRRAATGAAVFTACSADTLQDVRTFFGFSAEFGQVIYNGVRVADFDVHAVPGDPNRRPYVLAIGRHVPQKGFDVLLRAWASAAIASFDLVIAGDGVKRPALQRLAVELKMTDRIRFFGRADRQATVELFRGCSFFVLPSRIEPLGIVNLEAMAAGKAVVATRTGGVPELVMDGKTGLLVPPGDADALAAALNEIAGNAERRATFGRAGRIRAESFDWTIIAGQYLDVYQRAIALAGRALT